MRLTDSPPEGRSIVDDGTCGTAIARGRYTIGLSREIIDSALSRCASRDIKPEYLYQAFPAHAVEIGDCMIADALVTVARFEEFVGDTGYRTDAETEGWGWVMADAWHKRAGACWRTPFGDPSDERYWQLRATLPALQISRNDAERYCRWLSARKALDIRLPSEAEWEIWASRRGVPSLADIDARGQKTAFTGSASYLEQLISTHQEKKGLPGLLWEWCSGCFDRYPGGLPHEDFGAVYKVLRGGSLLSHPVQHAREYRFRRCPTARSPYYGFRIAESR